MTFPTFDNVDESEVILTVDSFETEETVDESTEQTDTEDTEDTEEIIETEDSQEDQGGIEEDPIARATYEALVEKGVIEADEAFDGSFDSLESKLDLLPSKLLKSAVDELPQHSQVVLKYIATAGNNLTEAELETYLKEYLNEKAAPDLSSLDTARAFMEKHLQSSGLVAAAIQAQLDALEDTNTLIAEAEKLANSKTKQTDKLIQAKTQENEAVVKQRQEFAKSINKTIQETGWAKSQQEKVIQTIPKTNELLQTIVKNPKAYVQFVDFLSKFNGTEFDLEAFRKQGEGRTASVLRDKLNKSGFTSGGSKTSSKEANPKANIFDEFKPVV